MTITKTFLATTGAGVARATGTRTGHWSVDLVLAGQDVRCLAANPRRPGVVYAGTQNQGVLLSEDNGCTWQSAGLAGHCIKALAVSQTEPGTLYAGTKPPMIFVSRDDGATWTELQGFRRVRAPWWFSPADGRPFTPYVQGLALSPSNPKLLLVGIELGAVLRSVDGGESWERHRPGALRDCHSLINHATHKDWFYEGGGTGAGVAFSRDAGKTWQQPSTGLDRHYGWAVAADPARPEVWYASLSHMFSRKQPGVPAAHIDGHAEAFIFRSAGGAPWQKLGGGLPQPLPHMAYALLTDPAAPGHVYAGLSNGDVWHSTNHGDSWAQLPFNLKSIHRTLVML